MGRRHISAVISLKDNMSATMRHMRREQKQFQKEVRKSRGELKRAQAESRRQMNIRMMYIYVLVIFSDIIFPL